LSDRHVLGSLLRSAALFAAVSLLPANAASISFQGSFISDDNLGLFTLNVGAPSTLTFLTLSYGGGVNVEGSAIARGGFDPILSLFSGQNDPNGALLGTNNDGLCPPLNDDAVTGACWDSLLEAALTPGIYNV